MDPDAALALLIDAAVSGDAADLMEAAENLADWIRRDGFPPADPRIASARA